MVIKLVNDIVTGFDVLSIITSNLKRDPQPHIDTITARLYEGVLREFGHLGNTRYEDIVQIDFFSLIEFHIWYSITVL